MQMCTSELLRHSNGTRVSLNSSALHHASSHTRLVRLGQGKRTRNLQITRDARRTKARAITCSSARVSARDLTSTLSHVSRASTERIERVRVPDERGEHRVHARDARTRGHVQYVRTQHFGRIRVLGRKHHHRWQHVRSVGRFHRFKAARRCIRRARVPFRDFDRRRRSHGDDDRRR